MEPDESWKKQVKTEPEIILEGITQEEEKVPIEEVTLGEIA